MTKKKKNKRIGIILDENSYKWMQSLWLALAESLIKDGAEVFLLPNINSPFICEENFDCFVLFSKEFNEKTINNIPFVTIDNKVSGHPNVSFNYDPDFEKLKGKMADNFGCKKIKILENFSDNIFNFHSEFDGVITIGKEHAKAVSDYLEKKYPQKIPVSYVTSSCEHFVNVVSGIVSKLINHSQNILNRVIQTSVEILEKDVIIVDDTEKINSGYGSLFFELAGVNNREELFFKLKNYFSCHGVENFAIVYEDENEKLRIYTTANEDNKFGENQNAEKIIEKYEILPEEILEKFSSFVGILGFKDILRKDSSFKYFISDLGTVNPDDYKKIAVAVGRTLENIERFELLEKEKEYAEKKSYERTEFFANMGNELCDPLKNIVAKMDQMEKNLENDIIDKEIIFEQILFLKSQLQTHLEKTQTLVDISSTEIDDFSLNKKLMGLKEILPEFTQIECGRIPLIFGDDQKLKNAFDIVTSEGNIQTSVSVSVDGVALSFEKKSDNNFDYGNAKFALCERILLLHFAEIIKFPRLFRIVFPFPSFLTQNNNKKSHFKKVFGIGNKNKKIFDFEVEEFPVKKIDGGEINFDIKDALLYWEADKSSTDDYMKLYSLRKNEKFGKMPIVCYSEYFQGKTFINAIDFKIKNEKVDIVLFIETQKTVYGTWATEKNGVSINSINEFDHILLEIIPSLIVFDKFDENKIKKVRKNPKTVSTPIIIVPDEKISAKDIEKMCLYPKVIFCNHGPCESEEFSLRLESIKRNGEILPPHTGALVKKAILYLNENYDQQIVRWKLADTVHVSEDYLTRVFHQETGLSLWEYLNKYRVYIARKMLLETNNTIYEIAEKTGFQDQAYFCRVFKKMYGVPPGKIRAK